MTRPPPLPRKNSQIKVAILLIPAAGLTLVLITVISGAISRHLSVNEQPHTVSEFYDLTVLAKAWEDNPVRANMESKGATIPIKGRVESIASGIVEPYVILAHNRFRVQCFFPSKRDVTALSRGQEAFIVGECRGMTLGYVVFVNCRLSQPTDLPKN